MLNANESAFIMLQTVRCPSGHRFFDRIKKEENKWRERKKEDVKRTCECMKEGPESSKSEEERV
jgi:hypothetical protein